MARSERRRRQENNDGTGCSSRLREQAAHTQGLEHSRSLFSGDYELKTQKHFLRVLVFTKKTCVL